MVRWAWRLVLVAGTMLGMIAGAAADGPVVTGTVIYLERMLLPEGAEARVTLEDVSRADAAAEVLAETAVPARSSPTPFALSYPADQLQEGHSYALRATIAVAGETMFQTTDAYPFDPAVTDGIELLVRRTGNQQPEPGITGAWLAEDIGGAGVIDDLQTTLTIAADGTVNGNGGCNGFGGRATISGDSISFGPLAGTLMACAEAIMGQENKFHEALGKAASFRTDADGRLILLDAAGTELVRFIRN
ncbi:MAG: META domain-containing protein [Hyphomicrobiales bacterium]|nr:MAG: META domain-containing protein [Hyphomicrobiales bacterium]